MDIIQLPLALIDEDKDQPRYQFDEEALQELMRSIEELGLLSPIKVRTADNGRYKIIYGNRRYKASQRLGLHAIPCIVSDLTNEMDIYLEQIAENLTREGFSPIEEAEAFDKLMNDNRFRSSIKFLSAKLGKPENYIKNKCELLKFSNAVKKLIVGGTEIRKDKLTEDQLMPLKDLPMEHRDPIALIAARDELPVSDVKKIAKLFKDKTISESTKEKLLLKTGPGLIETWSVYEQNRKERVKAEQARAEAAEARQKAEASAGQKTEASQKADATASQKTEPLQTSSEAPSASASAPGSFGVSGAPEGRAESGSGRSEQATSERSTSAPSEASLAALLEQWNHQLARQQQLSQSIAELIQSPGGQAQLFPHEMDDAILQLESLLALWKGLRQSSF
ncbi:ParB/RepB/Spo0J family partition protein [Paenibacillus sp. GCM10027627]|uniref:ParB/RepB/Spo0J family partition protein n=1 Tax=unclassified Paenibacillus TaxID=185978 RepID=UPI003625E7EC